MSGVVSNQRVVAIILGGLFLLGIILALVPQPGVVTLVKSDVFPQVVSRDTPLQVDFLHATVQPKIKLTLRSTTPLVIETSSLRYLMKPGFQVKGNTKGFKCVVVDGEYLTDVLVSPRGDSSRISFFPQKGTAQVLSLDYQVVKYKHNTTLNELSDTAVKWISIAAVIVLLLAAILHSRYREVSQWLCIGLSFGFVFLNEWVFCLLLLAYLTAMYLLRRKVNNGQSSVFRLFCFIGSAILFLVAFKYGKETMFHAFTDLSGLSLLLPIGVSYFIIRLVDTVLRWFRGQNLDCSYRDYLFYMFFPGTLIAGPIEGLQDFYDKRLETIGKEDVAYGVGRILIGFFKKIVIADSLLYPAILGERLTRLVWFGSGGSVNKLILDPANASGEQILMFGLIGMLFAYVDFSAYSDMAIGFSRLFGYRVRENFNFPIFATNLREYWKRWHMSLSEWSFRNAYFPLLIKSRNQYVPLFVTMMLIGMWHAPSQSWYSWAIHHAAGMTFVALLQKHVKIPALIDTCLAPLKVVATMSFVATGFIFVYFNDYSLAFQLYTRFWGWCLSFGYLC